MKPIDDLSGSQIELSSELISGTGLVAEERIDIAFSQSVYTTSVGEFSGTISSLPSWLVLDSNTGELVATPTHADTLALQSTN